MILLIFSLFIISFSTVGLFSATTYQAINNSFDSLNYTLVNSWIVTDVVEKLEQPYYDTMRVESSTIEHFKNNLAHYVKSFKVGFYYFNSYTQEEMKERYVTGVRISLRAPVIFASDYYRVTTYEINGDSYVH